MAIEMSRNDSFFEEQQKKAMAKGADVFKNVEKLHDRIMGLAKKIYIYH